jgi:hypothetical protein
MKFWPGNLMGRLGTAARYVDGRIIITAIYERNKVADCIR